MFFEEFYWLLNIYFLSTLNGFSFVHNFVCLVDVGDTCKLLVFPISCYGSQINCINESIASVLIASELMRCSILVSSPSPNSKFVKLWYCVHLSLKESKLSILYSSAVSRGFYVKLLEKLASNGARLLHERSLFPCASSLCGFIWASFICCTLSFSISMPWSLPPVGQTLPYPSSRK